MSDLPSWRPSKHPEGRFEFMIKEEPEKRRHNSGTEREFISVKFTFRTRDSMGEIRTHIESIVPWDEKYRNLLLALGGEEDEKGEVHLNEMVDIVGQTFDAEIIHEPDRDDSSKSWARIANIKIPERDDEDVPAPSGNGGDDGEVPF